MNHVPSNFIAAGYPMVLPNSLIIFYPHEITPLRSKVPVHLCSRHLYFLVLGKTACCIFHDGESRRQHLVQCFFVFLKNFFLQLIYLIENRLALFNICILDSCF